jgi:putrescine transport system substrate-binding protein
MMEINALRRAGAARAVSLLISLVLVPLGTTSAVIEAPILNVYNWFDYIAPDTIAEFTRTTGIKVHYDVYDSNEVLEAKLLVGSSAYDIVVPSGPYLERQINAGIYAPLDKGRLPNLKNLDPRLMALLARHDPGNAHAAMYLFGTTGIGFDSAQLRARAPGDTANSWKLIFDPAVVSRFRDCGVAIVDQPLEVVAIALIYLGLDANSTRPEDLQAVEKLLMGIRPYIRDITTSNVLERLAQGDLCMILGWNGQVAQARRQALDAKNHRDIAYLVPREGSLVWFDSMAIPKDAPHPQNAHRFIDFILDGRVHASISNSVRFANPNLAANSYVDAALLKDPGAYPPAEVMRRLVPALARSKESQREVTRLWTRFRTGL